jgi:hypothetical protein
MKLIKYLLPIILMGCSTKECFDSHRPFNEYDYCFSVPGTPQYKGSHP